MHKTSKILYEKLCVPKQNKGTAASLWNLPSILRQKQDYKVRYLAFIPDIPCSGEYIVRIFLNNANNNNII